MLFSLPGCKLCDVTVHAVKSEHGACNTAIVPTFVYTAVDGGSQHGWVVLHWHVCLEVLLSSCVTLMRCMQILEAYRVKLYAGFKRYFFYKNSQGLLGHEGEQEIVLTHVLHMRVVAHPLQSQ